MSWLVTAALCASPWLYLSLPGVSGYHDKQRFVQLGVAAAGGCIAAWAQWQGHRPASVASRPIAVCLALFFALGLLSSAVAHSPHHALLEWSNLLLLLSAAWLIASEVSHEGEHLLSRLLLVNGVACFLYAMLAITVCGVMLSVGQQPTTGALLPGFDNYRFFNHTQTASLPLLGLLAARTADRDRKVFWWTVTALWWMLLFLAAGRGTFMGLVLGTGAVFCLWRNAAVRRWCLSVWVAGLAGCLMYLLLYLLLPLAKGLKPFGSLMAAVDRSLERPTNGRWPLWEQAFDMVATHPWLGAGPMHFAHVSADLQLGAHPHSWVLQLASEWGLPATLCFVAAAALGIWTLWRTRLTVAAHDQRAACTLAAWLVTGIAIGLDGLVSGLIVMPASQLWITFYLGCAWGWVGLQRRHGLVNMQTVPARSVRLAGLMLMPLLVLVLLLSAWPQIRDIKANEARALRDSGTGQTTFRPRVWRAGYF